MTEVVSQFSTWQHQWLHLESEHRAVISLSHCHHLSQRVFYFLFLYYNLGPGQCGKFHRLVGRRHLIKWKMSLAAFMSTSPKLFAFFWVLFLLWGLSSCYIMWKCLSLDVFFSIEFIFSLLPTFFVSQLECFLSTYLALWSLRKNLISPHNRFVIYVV